MRRRKPSRPADALGEFWNAALAGELPDKPALDPNLSGFVELIHRYHNAEAPGAAFADGLESTLRTRMAAAVPVS
jgi:hypothetical protein